MSRLTLIGSFLLLPLVHAQDKCAALFVTPVSNLGDYGVNAAQMSPYYISMFRDTQTVAGIASKAGVLTQDIYNASAETHTTVVSNFRSRPQLSAANLRFREQVLENIDFVLEHYAKRRDWSAELREHLKAEAELYAEQSTYVEVRRLNVEDYTPGPLLGTMKIVKVTSHTPLQQLPLERDFNVKVSVNGGRKFEPANFVVEKDHNKLGTSEVFTQLILHAREQLKDPTHESDKMMYFTPADRLGVKMYERLGFKSVPGFEKPLKEGDKDWWIIGVSAETLARLPEHLAEIRSQWKSEDIGWMTQLVANFENLGGSKSEITGVRSTQITNLQGQISEMGVFVTEPFSHKGKDFRRLSVLSFGSGDIELNIRLPDQAFPLRDGWEQREGSLHLLYKDGVFKLYDTLFKTRLQIITDPAFAKPESLILKDRRHELRVRF